MKLSPHFTRHEFSCHCCGVCLVSQRLVDALEKLREALGGVPVHVTSGYRCHDWNKKIGGVPGSQHPKGTAADIVVEGRDPVEVAEKAEHICEFRHGGIGIYDTFTHLDVREGGPARWHG